MRTLADPGNFAVDVGYRDPCDERDERDYPHAATCSCTSCALDDLTGEELAEQLRGGGTSRRLP